jgi:hypothetical protein
VSLLVEFQDREVMPSVEAMASFEVSQDPSEATTNGMVVVSGEYFRIFSSTPTAGSLAHQTGW